MYESPSLLLSCGFQGCQICQPSPAERHSAERLTGLQLVFLEQITFRYKGGGLHFCGHIYVSTLFFVFVVWVTVLWWSSGWSWICYPGCYQTCDSHQVIFQRTVIMCVSHHTWLSSRVRAYLQVHSWGLRNTSTVMAEGWGSSSSTESTLKFHWKKHLQHLQKKITHR